GATVPALVFLGWRRFAWSHRGNPTVPLRDTSMPTLMADIGADMDELHAQIAVATRRLEMSVEQMKLKTASGLSEIGKTSEAIGRLKAELAERTAAFATLQAKERVLSADVLSAETDLATKTLMLRDVEKTLAERQAELARFMTDFSVHPEIGKLRQA